MLNELNKYNGIFFTSTNAVKYFFERANFLNVKYCGKIYSVGEGTKQKIESYGYMDSFIPDVYSAEGMVESLPRKEIEGKTFLFPRGNISMDKLQKALSESARVDQVIVYNNSLPSVEDLEERIDIFSMIRKGEIDCITFFSPSSIKNFILLVPGFRQDKTKIAVIGNTTQKTAEEFGLKVDIIPSESTSSSMAKAIIDYFNN